MVDGTPPFTVKALFEYSSEHDEDLTFPVGAVITVTEIEDDDWYSGTYGGKTGMFPRNFVKMDEGAAPVSGGKKGALSERVEGTAANTGVDADADADTKRESLKVDLEGAGVGSGSAKKPVPTPSSPRKHGEGASKGIAGTDFKPPVPGISASQKADDAYKIKKQFLGTGKSSYVPPVKPRDDSKILGHARHDVAHEGEIVKSSVVEPEHKEEDDGPKLSLKERISLLQKRQQEEEEREAAALKRQEERKQKAVEEREKLKHHREQNAQVEHEGHLEHHGDASEAGGSAAADDEDDTQHIVRRLSKDHRDYVEQPSAHAESRHNDRIQQNHSGSLKYIASDETERDEQPEDEDSEDEDLRRKKLIERMARISGGRNMFGMMGLAPQVGQASSAGKDSRDSGTVPPSEHLPKRKSTDLYEERKADLPHAVPIMPFADPNKLPKSLSRNVDHSDKEDGQTSGDEFGDVADTHVLESSEAQSPNFKDDNNFTLDENIKSADQSSDFEAVADPKLMKPPYEAENTGYEADEDLSDKPRLSQDDAPVKSSNLSKEGSSVRPPPPPPPVTSSGADLNDGAKAGRGAPPPIPTTFPEDQKIDRNIPELPSKMPPIPKSRPLAPAPPIPVPRVPDTREVQLSLGKQQSGDKSLAYDDDDLDTSVRQDADDANEDDNSSYDEQSAQVDDESANENFDFAPQQISKSFTMPESVPPPIPHAISNVESPPIGEGNRRSATDLESRFVSHQRRSSDLSSGRGSIRRTKSARSKNQESSQAELALNSLEYEIVNIDGDSNWWLKGQLPESFAGKIGKDLIYEIETNELKKRGGRKVLYKDYYILFYDLSQLVLELEYESEDPRSTVKFVNHTAKSAPIIRKDLLDKYYHTFGPLIINIASPLVGQKSTDSLINIIFEKLLKSDSSVLQPIGQKSFGVTIYRNNNNHSIAKIDDIKPGDVFCVRLGKFSVHKGLSGIAGKTIDVGKDDNIHAAVITEYDLKKERFKVIEQDCSGHIKKESYKLSDMKSGRVRVFRVVGRDYVEW